MRPSITSRCRSKLLARQKSWTYRFLSKKVLEAGISVQPELYLRRQDEA
jgi:hypothetical protein